MVRIKIFYIVIFLAVNLASFAQDRYVVHLSNKINTEYSVDSPQEYLSARALQRRINQNIAVTDEDFPVNEEYKNQIKATGASVFFSSRWFNNVLIQATADQVSQIMALDFVIDVTKVAPDIKLKSNSRHAETDDVNDIENAETDIQNDLLGVSLLHSEGFRGEGISIAFMDGGYQGVDTIGAFAHIFDENRLVVKHNFVENDDETFKYIDHGTKVLSTVLALLPNKYEGVAPAADLMLFITEDENSSNTGPEHRIEEYNFLYALEMADSAGVDIVNASVGYNTFDDPTMDYTYEQMDGKTAVITQACEKAFSKGIFIVTSTGNEGNKSWKYLTAPADGPNVLGVGAISISGSIASFSSVGPTSDGRIKPELVALGNSPAVINNKGVVTTGSGTSFSSPQIAGLAALLWQKYPELTNKELFDFMISLGDRFENPDNSYGYGIPNYAKSVTSVDEDRSENVVIYPNPFEDEFYLKGINDTEIELEVFDFTGKQVYPIFSWDIDQIKVRTDALNPGIYYLKINMANGQSEVHRILKY